MSVLTSTFVPALLSEFEDALSKAPTAPLTDNAEYMKLLELKFLLKNIRELAGAQVGSGSG
jgi:hypothetical protein